MDYSGETLWREFKPAQADLIFNVAMAATLVWIPLTAAAVGRCSFVRYRVTDKRLTVITDAPWKSAPPPAHPLRRMRLHAAAHLEPPPPRPPRRGGLPEWRRADGGAGACKTS